jgi:hypothetical protein
VLGAFLVLAFTGLLPTLPPALHLLILIGFAATLGYFGYRAALALRAPPPDAAARRLERDSGLAHRPLAVLADRPAGDDAMAQALWQAHRDRAVAQLDQLRVAQPKPGLAARDPRALRAAVLVALVASLGMAGREAPERLLSALLPPFTEPLPPAASVAARFEAWITPPAYTGAPPQFLNAAGGAVAVPAGSRLHMVFSGSANPPELRLGGAVHPFARMDAQSHALELPLTEGGALVLNGLKTSSGAYGDENLTIKRNPSHLQNGRFESEESVTYHLDTSWRSEVEHFFDCIEKDSPVTYGNSADALRLMELIDRTYASNKSVES